MGTARRMGLKMRSTSPVHKHRFITLSEGHVMTCNDRRLDLRV
jgi:hypothetical protein